jgi:hypothetical protein
MKANVLKKYFKPALQKLDSPRMEGQFLAWGLFLILLCYDFFQ